MNTSSTGRYLKPANRVSAPGSLFAVVVDCHVIPGDLSGQSEFHTFNDAFAVHSSWRNKRWTRTGEYRASSPRELWKWMGETADPSRRNYVITPSAPETLSTSQFWDQFPPGSVRYEPQHVGAKRATPRTVADGIMRIRRVVLNPRVGILDYAQWENRWVWLSGAQYFTLDEEALAKSMAFAWSESAAIAADTPNTPRPKTERARLWLNAFQQLCDWWRTHTKAPWGMTAASMAMGVLRTHVKPKALCSHSDPRTHELERSGSFGGRASVWYYGDVGEPWKHGTKARPSPRASVYGSIDGPACHLDVRSMYPFLLRSCEFPTHRTCYRDVCSRTDAQDYAESFGVIARVQISTEVAEYPERVGDRVFYRRGRFTTTLTGPELLRLKHDGKVLHTHEMSIYRLGRPFSAAAAKLIELREEARAAGRSAWELFAKLMSNGLAGKLAQRRGLWEAVPDMVPPYDWGEWLQVTGKGKKYTRFRALAGNVWEYKQDQSGEGPYTAAFAYLSAYGRLHMRDIREQLPDRSVFQQDTDGLWVTQAGRDKLDIQQTGNTGVAGELVVKASTPFARFLSPKHYFTNGGWVLAGFAEPKLSADALSVSDTVKADNHYSTAHRVPRGVSVIRRTSMLRCEAHGMKVASDGWATEVRRR